MTSRAHMLTSFWLIGVVALILVLILGANAHFLYMAISSQPGCAEITTTADRDGAARVLQPAKEGC